MVPALRSTAEEALHRVRDTAPFSAVDYSLHFTRLSYASSKVRLLELGEYPMSDFALPGSIEPARTKGPKLDGGLHPLQGIIYMGVVAAALLFVAYSIHADVDATGTKVTSYLPYLLLSSRC